VYFSAASFGYIFVFILFARTAIHSHIGHSTQTAGSAGVKVQNVFDGRNNITCSTECKYRTAATLNTVATWFVSGI
jgi:hypothetical protein